MVQLKRERYFWPILILLAAVAASISLMIGLRQSVWFDEAYSVLLAQHSWSDIVRLTAQDVHPPVYYWLLKAWMIPFGSSDLALRSLSALLLGASVIVAGLLVRRMFGAKLALMSLPFVVFAPFLLRYGFEIRMYSLASLIGTAATYVLVAALNAKTKRACWLLYGSYAFLVTLGVYTLYYMALLWTAHLAWVAWLAYKAKRPRLAVPAFGAYTASFMVFLPWLPIFLGKASKSTLSPVTHPLGIHNFIGIGSFGLLYRAWWQIGGLWALVLLIGVSAIAYLAYRSVKVASPQERSYLLLLALYVIVPVVILIVVTHIRPVYIERYLSHLLIGAYSFIGIAAALGIVRGDWRTRIAAAALVCALLAGCLHLMKVGNYNFQRLQKPSVREIAAGMNDCRDGAVVFANDPQVAIEIGYYMKDCPVRFYYKTPVMGGGYAMLSRSPLFVADPSTEFRGVRKLYYVYYDKPTLTLPAELHRTGVRTIEALSVATYLND